MKPVNAAAARAWRRRRARRKIATAVKSSAGATQGSRAGVQHAEQQRRHDRERQQVAHALRPHRERHDRGEQRHGPRGAELLDPAPERVAVQQRRLRGHDGDAPRAAAASAISRAVSSYSASASIAAITAIVGW